MQLDQSASRKLLLDELKIKETEPEAIMKELKKTSTKAMIDAFRNIVSVCSLLSFKSVKQSSFASMKNVSITSKINYNATSPM